ncbi:glycoside hydrolase family 43 protein [Rhizoctonia solani AG-3 Rhs1AP]|uniref:Glycoside hydrolase family 43 protein n=1 Tax=Rhizoctonia solani AG-3 Rhs1AP TaxID=1086054 RepID=X8J8A7_9AGAM|nr:glycoside hydrolase family 43 protein [Rhizoctonia solani AG-3 Rhs1AP]
MKSFRNPILPGFHPDPSCIIVDGVYYLATSSFLYSPGIPIYTSRDLVHWTQIGNVITRPSQLSLAKCTIRKGTKNCGGVWAPTIRYHKGTFYVVATCVFPDKDFADHTRWENHVWSTRNPHAHDAWSDGVRFDFPGYDTSLFWDENDGDRVYIQGALYWRVILSLNISETPIRITYLPRSKRVSHSTGRPIPEAPHMYHKDGWYYLLVAEGGTELDHCATIARSRSMWGPFEECPDNPIIHAASKDAYFQTIGHADIFQSPEGQWFAVALATRDGRINFPMGRETILIPGQWEAGNWPAFNARVESVMKTSAAPPPSLPSINENVLENFVRAGAETLWPHNLLRLRNPDEKAYQFTDGALHLWPSTQGDTLDGRFGAPTFVARRQTAIECTTEIEITLASDTSVVAGLSVYLDFESHIDLVLTCSDTNPGLQAHIRQRTPTEVTLPDAGSVPVDSGALRVIAYEDRYEFFGWRNGAWAPIGTGLAKEVSGGFTGVVIGPYAEGSASNRSDDAKVTVEKWVYSEVA